MLIEKYNTRENRIAWQKFLNTVGFNLDTDGVDGPNTENATKAFQNGELLRGDGIIGDLTIDAAKRRGFAGFSSSIEEPKKAMGKTVLVSAGHTNKVGQDRGAAGNSFIEGVEAVELRDSVAVALRKRNVKVVEDGADGINEPLTKAIALAKTADIAVEFHWNAGPPTATGIEVLAKPKHKALAQSLAGAIHTATKLALRGDKGWKADNSGQHHRLGFCEAGGLIIEVCFISNQSDMDAYEGNFGAIVESLARVLAEA